MTTINESQVNLSEKDIEDWLFANPRHVIFGNDWMVDHWLGRQVKVPSGIVDLIGICSYPYGPDTVALVVVEVKKVEINSAAVAQVCRYAADVERVLSTIERLNCANNWSVIKVVIGPGISTTTYMEAEATNTLFIKFDVDLRLSLNQLRPNKDFTDKRNEQYKQLAKADWVEEFSLFVANYGGNEAFAEFEQIIKRSMEAEPARG